MTTEQKATKRCIDCHEDFECTGETIDPDYGLHCTHDRCGACDHKHLFGLGIAFPNPIKISLGITKSYTMAFEDKDGHKNDDPNWEAKDEEDRLNNDIDPLTGQPYETRGVPQQRRRDPPMN